MRFIHIADVHLGMQPDAGFPWSEERLSLIHISEPTRPY